MPVRKSSKPKKSAARAKPSAKRAARPAKRAVKKKSAAKRSSKKPKVAPPAGAGPEVGRVVAFFRLPVVAVIRVTRGALAIGDRVWIKGHTTDQKLTVESLQIDHQPISSARQGQEAGVKVPARARRGDHVYRLPA